MNEVTTSVKHRSPGSTQMTTTVAQVPSWVMLFDDVNWADRHLTCLYGTNVDNMKNVPSDDGKSGFNDKCSSVMYCISLGSTCRLWENTNYGGKYFDLIGTGNLEKIDLKAQGFNDKVSSLQWI